MVFELYNFLRLFKRYNSNKINASTPNKYKNNVQIGAFANTFQMALFSFNGGLSVGIPIANLLVVCTSP